jgi:hypothetical protein
MMVGVLENYEPVEDRLAKFWAAHPDGRILTALLQQAPVIIFRAELYRADDMPGEPWATGHAHQRILDAPPAGSDGRGDAASAAWTSPFEVCETSALGRALANAGFAPRGARPSREEMRSARRRRLVNHRAEIARLGARVDGLSPPQRDAFTRWKDEQGWPWPWPASAIVAMHQKLDELAGSGDSGSDPSTSAPDVLECEVPASRFDGHVAHNDLARGAEDQDIVMSPAVGSGVASKHATDPCLSERNDGSRDGGATAARNPRRDPDLLRHVEEQPATAGCLLVSPNECVFGHVDDVELAESGG